MPYGAQTAGELKLAGLILEDFSKLHERIELEKDCMRYCSGYLR